MNDEARAERRRAQSRERQRRYRQRKAADRAAEELEAPPSDPDSPQMPVLEAVAAELARLPAAKERPGIAAAALAMARLLDSPIAIPQHPAAARQLNELLGSLRQKREAPSGKLGKLSAVPKPETA